MDISSSIVKKPWGYEYLAFENEQIAIWFLCIRENDSTSFHCHPNKKTGMFVLEGEGVLSFLSGKRFLESYDYTAIHAGVFHSTKSLSKELLLFEVESSRDKNDLIRLEDTYGRKQGYENESNWEPKDDKCFKITDGSKFLNYRFDILKLSEDKLKSFNEDAIIIPLNEDCVTPSTQPGLFKAGSILNIKILKKLLSTFSINKNCEVLKISKL